MKPIAIFKTGSTYPDIISRFGDFEEWILAGLGASPGDVMIVDANDTGYYPGVDAIGAVVITGAQEMVTDGAPWLDAAGDWIRELHDAAVPLLGICYGHQLLAHVMGGEVDYHPGGKELGSATVTCTTEGAADRLLGRLPQSFSAHESHWQTVSRLPEAAVRLAGNDHDPHQAFRIGDSTWGVQFHPEFTAEIAAYYIDRERDKLAGEGVDVDALRASVVPSEAEELLAGFARIAGA